MLINRILFFWFYPYQRQGLWVHILWSSTLAFSNGLDWIKALFAIVTVQVKYNEIAIMVLIMVLIMSNNESLRTFLDLIKTQNPSLFFA